MVWMLLVCVAGVCGACCVALALYHALQLQKPRCRTRGRCESRWVERDMAAPCKATGERTCAYPVGYRRGRGPALTPEQSSVLTCWTCRSRAEAVAGAQGGQHAEEESQRGPQALLQRRGAREMNAGSRHRGSVRIGGAARVPQYSCLVPKGRV